MSGASTTDANGVATATWTPEVGPDRRISTATAQISVSETSFTAFVVPATDEVVRMAGATFDPDSVNVAPGTTVTWIWPTGETDHNVEPVGGSVLPERSGDPVDGPFLYSQAIPFAGVFNYQCVFHANGATIFGGP